MIKNNLIIVAFNLPWDWSTDYTNQTATILSRFNLVICYVLGQDLSLKEYVIKHRLPHIWLKKTTNLYLYTPIQWLPFRRFTLVNELNNLINVSIIKAIALVLNKLTAYKRKILWVFDPQYHSIYTLFGKSFFWIYDMVDYFPGSVLELQQSKYIRSQEIKILKRADVVTSISHVLKRLNQKTRSGIKVVPQGFRLNTYQKYLKSEPTTKLPKNKPLIGYVGAINFRLNYNLLLSLIKNNPNYNFAFVGPIQADTQYFDENYLPKIKKLQDYPNVFLYGSQRKENIPALIRQFNVCIIPYNTTYDFNRYSFPMKFFEYLYCGKPIISSPIIELSQFRRYVKIVSTPVMWSKTIKQMATMHLSRKSVEERQRTAVLNSWQCKIEAISQIIEQRHINLS